MENSYRIPLDGVQGGMRVLLRYEQQRYAQGLADTTALALDPGPARADRLPTAVAALRRGRAGGPAVAATGPHQCRGASGCFRAARPPTNASARRQLTRAYQNRYLALRLVKAYDAHYNRLSAHLRRGQLWVLPLVVLEVLPLSLGLAVDWLRWRLSHPVRQLLPRKPAEAAGVRRQRVAAWLLLGIMGLLDAGAWWCGRMDWSLRPRLVAGFSVAAAGRSSS